MTPTTPGIEQVPTEENVKSSKAIEYAQARAIDWYAAEKLVYWDLEKQGVVRRPTIAQLARELGISRQTIYNWSKLIPDFEVRRLKAREALLFQNSTAVWNMIFLKACSGNLRAAEIYLTNFDPDFVGRGQKRQQENGTGSWVELLATIGER